MEPNRGRPGDRWFVFAQVLFAITSLVSLTLTLTNRIILNTQTEIALGVLAGALFYMLGIYVLFRFLRQTRQYRFRVALTGLPGAGKTVFSVLLLDSLMNERLPGVRFTGESKSVIAVYQAIRNLPAGIWPKATSRGAVSTYQGAIEAGRTKIQLEIGDSAGEYWLDLSDEGERDPGYLEYVISAHAIAHVIPITELLTDDAPVKLRQEIDDLLLAASLKRQTVGETAEVPLLIVLSKADLVLDDRAEVTADDAGLFRIRSEEGLSSLSFFEFLEIPDRHRVVSSIEMLDAQLRGAFMAVRFILSSAPMITNGRLALTEPNDDLLNWIMQGARETAFRGRARNRFLRVFDGASR